MALTLSRFLATAVLAAAAHTAFAADSEPAAATIDKLVPARAQAGRAIIAR